MAVLMNMVSQDQFKLVVELKSISFLLFEILNILLAQPSFVNAEHFLLAVVQDQIIIIISIQNSNSLVIGIVIVHLIIMVDDFFKTLNGCESGVALVIEREINLIVIEHICVLFNTKMVVFFLASHSS